MSKERSRGIIGIFVLTTVLFFIFIIFAFYTVSNLRKASDESSVQFNSKDAPIAVVEVEGVIMDPTKTIKKLLIAEKDKKIKAIILRVNSPGGAVGPTQEIYEEIRRIDENVKPIYASFGAVSASGGYYIGAACRKIYSNAGAMTGSIGVIMNFMNLSKLYEWVRVSPEIVKAGKYKDIGSAARNMTQEERSLLTGMIANVHDQFINDIWAVRKDKIKGGKEGLREYAQGQIFSGEEARDRGLVDELAGLWKSGRMIHKELKLKEDFNLKVIKLKRDLTLTEIIGGIEESVQDLSMNLRGFNVPLLMYK